MATINLRPWGQRLTTGRITSSKPLDAWGVILALLISLICPRMLGPILQWPSDSVPGDSEARTLQSRKWLRNIKFRRTRAAG